MPGALYWARLDRFFYGNSRADAARFDFDDSFIYDEMSKHPEGRTIPGMLLLSTEALKDSQNGHAQRERCSTDDR